MTKGKTDLATELLEQHVKHELASLKGARLHRFLEQELLEVSAVPVPANRNALRRALDQTPRLKEYLAGFDLESSQSGKPKSGQGPQEGSDSKFASKAGSGAAAPDSPLEAILPRLWAQADELGKLANEMAELVEEAGLAIPKRI